jgi:hypothetical protein
MHILKFQPSGSKRLWNIKEKRFAFHFWNSNGSTYILWHPLTEEWYLFILTKHFLTSTFLCHFWEITVIETKRIDAHCPNTQPLGDCSTIMLPLAPHRKKEKKRNTRFQKTQPHGDCSSTMLSLGAHRKKEKKRNTIFQNTQPHRDCSTTVLPLEAQKYTHTQICQDLSTWGLFRKRHGPCLNTVKEPLVGLCPWGPHFLSPRWHESPWVCVHSGQSPHRYRGTRTHTHTPSNTDCWQGPVSVGRWQERYSASSADDPRRCLTFRAGAPAAHSLLY